VEQFVNMEKLLTLLDRHANGSTSNVETAIEK